MRPSLLAKFLKTWIIPKSMVFIHDKSNYALYKMLKANKGTKGCENCWTAVNFNANWIETLKVDRQNNNSVMKQLGP